MLQLTKVKVKVFLINQNCLNKEILVLVMDPMFN